MVKITITSLCELRTVCITSSPVVSFENTAGHRAGENPCFQN